MNRSVYVGGGYRARVERKKQRQASKTKADREDAIAYAEPHLRDYEAAHQEYYGTTATATYLAGWVYINVAGHEVAKRRLQQTIADTAILQARVHERAITNGGQDGA